MHMTGEYPDWWKGKRFRGPIRCYVAGVTNQKTRDVVQRKLFGDDGHFGTGFIPGDRIVRYTMGRNVSGLIDTAQIRHKSGGNSWVSFMSYDMKLDAWASDTLDFIWFDEEPPPEIFSEGLARVKKKKGITMLTFTPLFGMTDVVGRFYPEPEGDDFHLTHMGIEDSLHINESEREAWINEWPEHEREARGRGIPMQGAGLVYPVSESFLKMHKTPEGTDSWREIGGLDFGWNHPTAAVRLLGDPVSDSWYLTHCYRRNQQLIQVHASALKSWGKDLPWAWGKEAYQTHSETGRQTRESYNREGLRMLPLHATNAASQRDEVYESVVELTGYMETGRFKVAHHLDEWWQEFRGYHRKLDNQGRSIIVNRKDDLMAATRYAFMMRRFARPLLRHGVMTEFADADFDPLEMMVQ